MGSTSFKEIISENNAFYRKRSLWYKNILILLGIITLTFIKCDSSKGINADKNGLVYSISCNLSMMLHGKMYLAESQFQNGTRVKQAAAELQINLDFLSTGIRSQTVVFFNYITLLSAPR